MFLIWQSFQSWTEFIYYILKMIFYHQYKAGRILTLLEWLMFVDKNDQIKLYKNILFEIKKYFKIKTNTSLKWIFRQIHIFFHPYLADFSMKVSDSDYCISFSKFRQLTFSFTYSLKSWCKKWIKKILNKSQLQNENNKITNYTMFNNYSNIPMLFL